MDYYERKKLMFEIVERLIKEGGHSRTAIIFDTMRNTGISKKAINAYIDDLVDSGIKEEKGVLIWH